MKRYNKIDFRWVIIGIVCPILAFLFSMSTVYAYFTATANNSNVTSKTGIIKIIFNPLTKQLNTTEIGGSATVYPGDTLNINGSLVNDGANDCYAILEFEVYVQKYGASSKETAIHKYYAYEGNALKEITGTTGSYSAYASIISSTSGSNTKPINLSYKFVGEQYDNSYKKATVTYAVNGYAIQTANVSQTKATDELLDMAGYKYLRIYGNSVQNRTPSPTSPVEIQSVGDRTKNLFNDKDKFVYNSQEISAKNGVFEIPAYSHGNFYLDGINIPENTDTVISVYILDDGGATSGTMSVGTYYKSESYSNWGNVVTFTFSNATASKTNYSKQINTTGLMIFCYQLQNINPIKIKVQLEYGTTATDYVPYGYQIPITVRGKNIINPAKWTLCINDDGFKPTTTNTISTYGKNYIQTTLSSWEAMASNIFEIEKFNSFGFKINKNSVVDDYILYRVIIQYYDENQNKLSNRAFSSDIIADTEYIMSKYDFPPLSTAKYFKVGIVARGEKIENLKIYDMYINEDNSTTFEPYVEPTTTYIYLDEPLRKVGDYADYIDLQTGTLVRQVGKYTFTGNETWSFGTEATANGLYRNYTFFPSTMLRGSNVPGFSNVLPSNVNGWNAWTKEQMHFGQANTALYLITTNQYSNASDIYNHLTNNGANEAYVYYTLATPTETQISVPDLGQYNGSVIEIGTALQPSSTLSSNETQFPSEYQELDYITMQNNSSNGYSNGILTDITFANSDRIEMSFSSTDTSNSMMFFCGYTNTVTQPYVALTTSGYSLQSFDSITANQELTRAQASDGTVRTLSFDYSSTSKNKILFGAWSDAAWSRTITWYSFKILKRGSIIANFIPCYRKSDNVIGMYDTVSGKFYTNHGTGTFLKGNNV